MNHMTFFVYTMSEHRYSGHTSQYSFISSRLSFLYHCVVVFVITRDSEVIMFSPCVFVCLFVCVCVCVVVYVCHDVCPDDLTMKDLCHTNNILQVHCWGCLVVQVMFRALMTSLMTSQDHGSQCSWLSFWYIQLPVWLPLKKVCRELKMAAILKNFKY